MASVLRLLVVCVVLHVAVMDPREQLLEAIEQIATPAEVERVITFTAGEPLRSPGLDFLVHLATCLQAEVVIAPFGIDIRRLPVTKIVTPDGVATTTIDDESSASSQKEAAFLMGDENCHHASR